MAIVKPDLTQQWASDGDKIAPSGAKIQAGWGPEIPPYQWENFIQNRQDEMLAYLNERGIPEWDNRTDYIAGKSYVQGSDGAVYKSVAASGPSTTVQDPTTDVGDTYWTVAFADVGTFLSQAAGDARYLQISNNLSDLTDAATARATLDVYSKAETDNQRPAGQVGFFAQPAAPTGWLKANGAAVSRSTYAALFAAIGTTFGAGDGSTTFDLPDLRGEFIRGWDDNRGVDSGRVFGSGQADEFKAHGHRLRGTAGPDGPLTNNGITGGSGGTQGFTNTTNVESSGGVETRPRNIALLACIKY